MRIGLNLLHMHEGIGGVWNYVENMISALGAYDRKNTYIVFATPQSRSIVPDQENFQTIIINIDPKKTWRRVFYENTMLCYHERKHNIDCLHWVANMASPFSTVPGLVTIHDLLPLRNPGAYPRIKQLYLNIVLKTTARKAKSLLPVSHTTASDVVRILKPKSDKVHVVPVIIKSIFKPSPRTEKENFQKKYKLPGAFWLYVANFYPHKNHIRLIKAYGELKRKEGTSWPLVLRGDSGPDTGATETLIKSEIKKLKLEADVIWLPRLAYHELPVLYSTAGALVFPSLFEGCGIPVIEAMACGCPVAASQVKAVEEFGGNAVFFFNGEDTLDIYHAMARLQQDRALREELSSLGLSRARLFSGEQVVDNLQKAYKEAVS